MRLKHFMNFMKYVLLGVCSVLYGPQHAPDLWLYVQ